MNKKFPINLAMTIFLITFICACNREVTIPSIQDSSDQALNEAQVQDATNESNLEVKTKSASNAAASEIQPVTVLPDNQQATILETCQVEAQKAGKPLLGAVVTSSPIGPEHQDQVDQACAEQKPSQPSTMPSHSEAKAPGASLNTTGAHVTPPSADSTVPEVNFACCM